MGKISVSLWAPVIEIMKQIFSVFFYGIEKIFIIDIKTSVALAHGVLK